jgi:hypothetical protein
MSTTSQMLRLVREGRATPHDAALLIELRRQVAANRQRAKLRERPLIGLAAFVGLFILTFFGLRRED